MNEFDYLHSSLNSYAIITDDTWSKIKSFSRIKVIKKSDLLIQMGQIPTHFYFVYKGLFRAFCFGGKDGTKEINKVFFKEGSYPASVCAALKQEQSLFAIEALEDSIVIQIDYKRYRNLLEEKEDLKWFHIKYIEQNWIIEKEIQEVSLLSDDAKERYLQFLSKYPELVERLPLFHLASKLGITPTQLSRIRNDFK